MVQNRQWSRLIWAAFLHADEVRYSDSRQQRQQQQGQQHFVASLTDMTAATLSILSSTLQQLFAHLPDSRWSLVDGKELMVLGGM